MPAGDYNNCNKCGKAIFGYGLCDDCAKQYNFGMSYDVYGNVNSKNVYFNLPPNPNDGGKLLADVLNKKLKSDAKKHVDTLAAVMGEPPISEGEFEEFWDKYIGIAPALKEELAKETEELLDDKHYQEVDKNESIGCGCGCNNEYLPKTPNDGLDELDELISDLEKEVKQDESLGEIFDRFFNETPTSVAAPAPKKVEEIIDVDNFFNAPEVVPAAKKNELKRKTLVVNLFAGPGSGKSTTAAGVFFELKSRGINCELATEFVKDLVWEERHKAIDNQVYIFAKQHHRIARLLGEVDVIITDSPLLLTLVYGKKEDYALKRLAAVEHNKLWTLNCFIKRNKEYNPKGRWQTYDEARNLDRSIATMLDEEEVPYEVYFGNADGKDKIVDKVLKILGHKQ